MRVRDPKTTAPVIFTSGKMVVTSAKYKDESRLTSLMNSSAAVGLSFVSEKIALAGVKVVLSRCETRQCSAYNPKCFVVVITRIPDLNTIVLIFALGKMAFITGSKDEDESRLASRKYARIVQKLGFDAKLSDSKI